MDFNNFQTLCKEIVTYYHNSKPGNELVNSNDVYVVWYCKTLQHAKALLSTPLPDGMYYEVTYNGDKNEFYLDAYKKEKNLKIEMGDI